MKPAWKIRRRIIALSLLFCACVTIFVLYKGEDLAIYEAALLYSFGLAGSVIGSYIFGAVWDDKIQK